MHVGGRVVHLGLDLPETAHDGAYTDTPFHGTVHGASIHRFMKQRTVHRHYTHEALGGWQCHIEDKVGNNVYS